MTTSNLQNSFTVRYFCCLFSVTGYPQSYAVFWIIYNILYHIVIIVIAYKSLAEDNSDEDKARMRRKRLIKNKTNA